MCGKVVVDNAGNPACFWLRPGERLKVIVALYIHAPAWGDIHVDHDCAAIHDRWWICLRQVPWQFLFVYDPFSKVLLFGIFVLG